MYPFTYNPFFPFSRPMRTISGIPVLRTTGVTASATEVRYDVRECEYRRLPKEGLFFLDVRQSAPTGSGALPVAVEAGETVPNGTSMLVNARAEDVVANDLIVNIRYLIYYNKCTKTYQLVNSYPTAATPTP